MASPLFISVHLCSVRAGKTTEDIHRRPQLTAQVKGIIANVRGRCPGRGDRPARRPPADQYDRAGLPPRVAPRNHHWRRDHGSDLLLVEIDNRSLYPDQTVCGISPSLAYVAGTATGAEQRCLRCRIQPNRNQGGAAGPASAPGLWPREAPPGARRASTRSRPT